MRECGSVNRLPLVPQASSTAPIDAACPTQYVTISGSTRFIVSRIARPAVIEPPGELMYSEMSFSGSSAARNSIWAMIRLAIWSSIGVPRKMMFSLSSRE